MDVMKTCRLYKSSLILPFLAAPLFAQSLVNPGFEGQESGWSKSGRVEIADWAAETGQSGAAFQGWVSEAEGHFEQSLRTVPDSIYTFKIRGKKQPNFPTGDIYIKAEFYGKDNLTRVGTAPIVSNVAPVLTTEWQTFIITAETPAEASYVHFSFGFRGGQKPDLKTLGMAAAWDNAELSCFVKEPVIKEEKNPVAREVKSFIRDLSPFQKKGSP